MGKGPVTEVVHVTYVDGLLNNVILLVYMVLITFHGSTSPMRKGFFQDLFVL